MDYTKQTLGRLLASENEIIARNAMSILKEIQRCKHQHQAVSSKGAVCLICDKVLHGSNPNECPPHDFDKFGKCGNCKKYASALPPCNVCGLFLNECSCIE